MQTINVSLQLLSLTDFWERKAQSPSPLRCTTRKVRQHVTAFMPSLELPGAYGAFYLFLKRIFHSIFTQQNTLTCPLVHYCFIAPMPGGTIWQTLDLSSQNTLACPLVHYCLIALMPGGTIWQIYPSPHM